MRALLCILIVFASTLAYASPFRQTEVTYPPFRFVNAELASATAGAVTSDFVDVRAETWEHFAAEILWSERANRPCAIKVLKRNVNNLKTGFFPLIDKCNGPAFDLHELVKFTRDGLPRTGIGSGVAVCLNNTRVKGIRTEVIEFSGSEVETGRDQLFIYKTFQPVFDLTRTRVRRLDGDWAYIDLTSSLGFEVDGEPGELATFKNEAKRVNCKNSGWTDFVSCNPGNRVFTRAITGLRLYFGTDTSLRGIQPYCSEVVSKR